MRRQGTIPSVPLSRAVIDALEFARQDGHIEGEIPVTDLHRLADQLVDSQGSVACSVTGEVDRDGHAYLVLAMSGELRLRCQRCLQALVWPLQVASRMRLVAEGEAWPDEDLLDDDCDPIEADKALALLSLIEDEILLAVPISPRHEACELPAGAVTGGVSSPFASLAQLKKI
jgi:uncharacterized protein